MKPSQRKMASNLGVSHTTVSRALRGDNGVSEKTRKRILAASRKVGVPLPPMRKAAGRPGVLNIICAVAPPPSDETTFHTRLLCGLVRGGEDCAAEVVNVPRNGNHAAWPLMVTRKQADGVVVVWGDEHSALPSADCPIPVIYVFHGPPHSDVVTADNFGGGFQIGSFLAGQGHRRVAFFGQRISIGLERLGGLCAGLRNHESECPAELTLLRNDPYMNVEANVDWLLAQDGVPLGEFKDKARARPAGHKPFSAIVAYNDLLAAQAVKRLNELGLRVPEDMSVAGFDGIALAGYDGPALTTAAIPLEELGAEASRLVYWRIEHPNAVRRKLSLETELVKGGTVQRVG